MGEQKSTPGFCVLPVVGLPSSILEQHPLFPELSLATTILVGYFLVILHVPY